MLKTPLPKTKHIETDTDKYFTYLVSHVTRQSDNQPIATISPDQSAQRTWTTPQVTVLAILATLTLIALWCYGIVIITGIFTCITVLYVALLALSTSWMIAVTRVTNETPFNDQMIHDLAKAPWPTYTILCPLYREKAVVPQFVNAMKALDYPADCLQVLFLTEQDDTETRAALRAMTLPAGYEIITVPAGTPRTKPRACNYGLTKATGEYCVIFDAEDIPDPLQLKKAVLTFASNDVNVACVQARLNFYNPTQNLLTRWFCAEYSLWFDLILPGLQRLGFSLPLGGTSNHFRISALRALGGWDSYNVTEDCDLGLKLSRYAFKTIMLDSTTHEEANSRVFGWIRQRSRWIKGYMQTYLVHTRHPLKAIRQGKIKDLLSLHLFVGAGSVVLLINPIMWLMFAVYLIWRPVDLYHQLFPWPVLYSGMLCFLVGNFLPVYVSMIACVKREQYSLVKWCLLLPFYWILASVAAFMAGYELIVNPHKWHKTQHGLHLKDKKSTQKIAAISMKVAAVSGVSKVGTVTQSVRAMSTVLVPAISKVRGKRTVKARDPWLVATIVLACVCSVAATAYFFQHHEILLYGDALSHMRLARSVFDSLTPGLAQLGGVWLPLPHILMWPFVWNDYLWRTGLAGSCVSMPCYVISTIYLYLAVKRLTGKGQLGFIACLVFILNPNILYLQSTPLSELVCIATFTSSCYYFLCWVQTDRMGYLLTCTATTFLATLARYDGWALFIGLLILVATISVMKHRSLRCIEAHIITFGVFGSLGIVLWMAWCGIILGDPFYFQRGPFSAQSQQKVALKEGVLYTYHSLRQSIKFYTLNSADTLGTIMFALFAIALIVFLIKKKITPESLAVLAFLAPFAFYVVSLYTGQAVIWVPGAVSGNSIYAIHHQLFNDRYGAQMVIPVALFLALPLQWLPRIRMRIFSHAAILACVGVIIGQSLIVASSGVISIEDGRYGDSCAPAQPTDYYFAQHYNGGRILVDTFNSNFNEAEDGIDMKDIVYDGSGNIWHQALHDPLSEQVVWIVANAGDLVSSSLNVKSTAFLQHYMLVSTDIHGRQLFHEKGLAPLPNRILLPGFLSGHTACAG